MNNRLDEILHTRRSIRRYTSETPPEHWIEAMVEAVTWAPSPSNTQPVRILRIGSTEKREVLHQVLMEGRQKFLDQFETENGPKRIKNWINSYYRYSEFMVKAPLLFAFGVSEPAGGFSHKLQAAGLISRDTRHCSDMDITVGLALKGFILKATDLGLGSCILTAPLVFIKDIERLLGLNSLRIACLVTAGFPDETPAGVPRKKVTDIYSEI